MESLPSAVVEPLSDPAYYVCTPLPLGDYFRYLTLEPGTGDEPLRCSIYTSAIPDADYEAISYVWGSEIKSQRILCDGYAMKITKNLWHALRRLRRINDARYLWADSICIDQDNLEEKGHQVTNMGRIYSSASRVLIYLGLDPDGHGSKVASLLSDVDEFLQSEMTKVDSLKWNVFPELSEHACHPLLINQRWYSVRELLELQWFERGWVVREAGLAKQGLLVWGHSDMSWQKLLWVASWMFARAVSLPGIPLGYEYRRLGGHLDGYVDRHLSTLQAFLDPTCWTASTFLAYLGRGRRLRFKDRRDNIYAFLDLGVTHADEFHVTPDYTKSLDEVFKTFATQYLKATGDQTILSFVIHDGSSLQSSQPTWVPKWNEMEPVCNDEFWKEFTILSRKADTCVEVDVLNDSILKIHGVLLGQVAFVSETRSQSTTTPSSVRKLWEQVAGKVVSGDMTPSHQISRLVSALLWVFFRSSSQQSKQSHVDGYIERLLRRDDADEQETSKDFEVLHSFLALNSNAKNIMVTDRDYFGLAPAVVREGDIIARLLGSKSLPGQWVFLLRATNEPLHYKLVGPAWISYHIEYGNRVEEDYTDAQDIYLC